MSRSLLIEKIDEKHLKRDIPFFEVGDTIRVHTRIIEGNKERIQIFAGTVIAKKGSGIAETFSIHRIAYGEGMERVFLLHSPRIAEIEVMKKGKVRRAKLYYLRGKQGKAAKVQAKLHAKKKAEKSGNENDNVVVEANNEPKPQNETAPSETASEEGAASNE